MKKSMKAPFNGQSAAARNILSILFIFIFHFSVFSQFTEFNTGSFEDVWNDVVVDSEGNIYTVGTYTNNTTIEGNYIQNDIISSFNKTQLMVAKYNSSGVLQWLTYGISPCIGNNKGWSTGTRIAIGETTGKIFIAGEHAGMKLQTLSGSNFLIDDIPSDPNDPSTACLGSDIYGKPFIISLNKANGNYLNYTNDLRGIVTSMVVANDGPFANQLYSSLYNQVDKNVFIYRIDHNTLAPAGGNYLIQSAGTGIDHIINDIKYVKQKIYCIGTTNGSVQFGGMTMSISLSPGQHSAWAAIVSNPSGSISISAMKHGGSGSKMTGDQIYLDQQNNIVIAGRYSDALVYPFGSSQTYTSLSSTVLKNAYLMRLNSTTLFANDVIHTIETTMSQYNVDKVSLTGIGNRVFISMSYTGRLLYFVPYSGSYINLISPIYSSETSKIAVAAYKTSPLLNEEWYNTTYGLTSNDLAYANANAVYQDLIYTVGNLKERMYFDYFPTLNSPISSTSSSKKAMMIRNDDDWTIVDGGFKSYNGEDDEDLNDLDISIYPNPNRGSFYLSNVSNNDKIEVFDLLGKTVSFTLTFSGDKAYIEIENPTNIILLKVNDVGFQVMINE